MNYEAMTIDELNAVIQQKGNEIDTAKDELRAICRIRDGKAKFAEAHAALNSMDPKTRAQFLSSVGGIPSGEAVGKPGGR